MLTPHTPAYTSKHTYIVTVVAVSVPPHYAFGADNKSNKNMLTITLPTAPLTVPNRTEPCVGVDISPGCLITNEPTIISYQCKSYQSYQSLSHSLRINGHFPGEPGLAKDDGGSGDYWSCKSCKAPVKSSPPTNQYPVFYRPDALPVAQPTVSKH